MHRCPYCHREVEFVVADRLLRCPRPQCLSNRLWDLPVPREYVADYVSHPPLLFSLIGLPGHGKTVYLEALVASLSEFGRHWDGFSFSARPAGQLFGNILPNATAAHQAFPPHFVTLTGVPGVGNFQLLAHDTSGENFANDESLRRYALYALHSNHVVWLVGLVNRVRLDSETAEEMKAAVHTSADWVQVAPVPPSPEQDPDSDGRADYRLILGSRQVDDMLRVYREAALGQKRSLGEQTLLVVLTKADELHVLEGYPPKLHEFLMHDELDPAGDAWERLDELSDLLRDWLNNLGYHNFLRNIHNYFREVRFCSVSAMGSPRAVRPEPRGVFAPVLWLLRLQRPNAWVETEQGRTLHFDLEEALRQAPPGATVRLGPGEYRLDVGLELTRPVTIAGAGRDGTILSVNAAGARQAIAVTAPGGFALTGIQIQAGETTGDVVRVSAGSLALTDCFIGRGRADSASGVSGHGLVVENGATATARRCGFLDSDGAGIVANGTARVLVEDCHARRNRGPGFLCRGAVAILRGNKALNNDGPGIVAEGPGEAIIENNECGANLQSGIDMAIAEGRATGNHLVNNQSHGLHIRSPGRLVIVKNECSDNDGSGICVAQGTAIVQENICVRNARSGVAVLGSAQPTIEKNSCTENGEHGVHLSEASAGFCRENDCRANRSDGIRIDRAAQPIVGSNTCEANGSDGIAVCDTARPEIDHNDCTGNARHGIFAAKSAKPHIGRHNTCRTNHGKPVNDQRSWL